MANTSYHPLSPLKSFSEGVTSPSPEQPFKDDQDLSRLPDMTNAEGPPGSRSSMFPLRSQVNRKSPNRTFWHVSKTPLEMALLPLAAIAYLAFCYTVHDKIVPVNTYGLYAVTPQHLSTIKGGITTISILVITIALYPIGNIIANLKSEEFFRVLASRNQGVPLETVNHISTPTFGYTDMMLSVWNNTCSNHYILGIVVSLFVFIVSTLAPGALTIDSVLSDGDVMAIAIGAVSAQSVLNGSYSEPSFNASVNSDTAASVTWAEMELGVQYSFGVADTSEPEYAAYIAPIPLNLDTATEARWLSDVIGINPTCSWAATNLTTMVQVPSNSSSIFNGYLATAYLVDVGSDVQVIGTDLPNGGSPFATVKSPQGYVTNHTTQAPTSDGSTIFLLGQCISGTGCTGSVPVNITIDLSDINNTFKIALSDQVWTMAILACLPNVTIETREVRSDGHGMLTIQPRPAGGPLRRQGNLNPVQTTALFSISTMSLTQSAGPLTGTRIQYSSLGGLVQGDVLYGNDQYSSLPGNDAPFGTSATLAPQSIDAITQRYTKVLTSSAKSYLAGYLGTAYVPGRLSSTEIVFAAAVPNLAVATAVFALLAGVIVLAHFRPKERIEFTLVNLAAAVHGSELPAQFANIKTEQGGHTDMDAEGELENDGGKGKRRQVGAGTAADDQDLVAMMGERRVFMQRRADGSPVLHMS